MSRARRVACRRLLERADLALTDGGILQDDEDGDEWAGAMTASGTELPKRAGGAWSALPR
jgi:hypothetical protein